MKTTLIACTLNEIEAVQVVLPQIDKSWVDEIIIADGGSTDGTVEYCQEHGYTVMRQHGRGYGAGIREAVKIAKGDIIVSSRLTAIRYPLRYQTWWLKFARNTISSSCHVIKTMPGVMMMTL